MKKLFPHLVLILCLITLISTSIIQTINTVNLKTELNQRKAELTNIAAGSNLNAQQVQNLAQQNSELKAQLQTEIDVKLELQKGSEIMQADLKSLYEQVERLEYERNVANLTLLAVENYNPDAINNLPTLPENFSPLQKEIQNYLENNQ